MTDPDLKVWSDMLAHLRNCHPAICRQWFEELEPCGVAGGTMQLRAQTALHREYLRRECSDPFGDAARTATGRLLSVRFLGPDDHVLPQPPPPRRATVLVDPTREVYARPHDEDDQQAEEQAEEQADEQAKEQIELNGHLSEAIDHDHRDSPDYPGTNAVAPNLRDSITGAPRHPSPRTSSDNYLTQVPSRISPNEGGMESGTQNERGGQSGSSSPARRGNTPAAPVPAGRAPASTFATPSSPPTTRSSPVSSPNTFPPEDPSEPTRPATDFLDAPTPPPAATSDPKILGYVQTKPQSLEPRVLLEPVRFLEPRVNSGAPRAGRSSHLTPPARYESLVVNPDYCFENFVVGPGNRMAHAAAQAISNNPGRVYNPFFVHAGVGLGKTHLLQAICLRIAQTDPGAVMYYTSCEGFVTQFFDSVKDGEMSDFRHRFRDVDVLVIDDIHFLGRRESSQEEFFHTFNALYQMNKQIILSCDAAPEDIPDLEDRLVSRFKWGLVTRIEQPIFETRVTILKSKAQIRGLELPDDVACFIAGKINTNIRELEGAIVKLHIQANVEQRPIDMDLAREALGDSFPQPKGEPTLQAIINAVTEFFGVRLTDLQSKGRQRSIALPRQVCMFLARRCTRHSLEEIGGFFGGRDHTTVMHAVETVEVKRKADSEFDLVLRSLEDRVRSNKAA